MSELDNQCDYFSPDPGLHNPPIFCGVCGTEMEITRSVNGPRSFAQAMAKGKSLHDTFVCPQREEQWHMQVRGLNRKASETISPTLRDIYLKDAEAIKESKQATKAVYSFMC